MYTLTLSAEERAAFDWVGDRYNAGKISDLLCECMPADAEWSQEGTITFHVPEHIAWQINELAREESYSWPCFSVALSEKLTQFCDSII